MQPQLGQTLIVHSSYSWGYVILYLIIIIVGLIGNFLFCLIIKKCEHLHRTHHFFFLAIAVMDMLACVLVVPFAMDSSVADISFPNSKRLICSVLVQVHQMVFAGVFMQILPVR